MKNKNWKNKKIFLNATITMFVIFFVISIAFIVVETVMIRKRNNEYTKLINSTISQIVMNVEKNYPNVKEEDIIDTLRNKNEYNVNYDILKKYGYDDDIIYLKSLREEFNKSNQIYLTIDFTFVIMIIGIAYLFNIRERKKIQEIDNYLKKMNNGNYKLGISENTNDDLSKLRNEIYKTTVLLKEAAENSSKESRELSDSLADVSHQLKTPLTSMRIMLDNIEDNPNMDEKTKKDFINTISKQVDWMSYLVISLLKFSRFDAGMIVMHDEEISASELIKNVIENLSILIEVKNITVILNVNEKAKFNADYKWQLEAITNILKNAVEHSEENSKIFINVEDSSVLLKISIKDNGSGIKKEDMKHIFERFYKSENSSENSIGIGLALAKTIIEKDSGYIFVKSEEGKGTEFIIKYLK